MKMKPADSIAWIKSRRSVFPKMFSGTNVNREMILELLEAARWAPTHKLTEPWRFMVFMDDSKHRLVETQIEGLKELKNLKAIPEVKVNKMKLNAEQSAAIVAIVMQRDALKRVPQFEEICAVACAVQNIALHAGSLGLGGYWSTGAGTNSTYVRDELDLKQEDIHLGWFYLGEVQSISKAASERLTVDRIAEFR